MHISDLSRKAFAPVDNSSIVLFRIAFGLIAFVEVTRYFGNGWITQYYVAPHFFFKYYGFGWVRPWPGKGMYVHFYLLGMLAAAVCAGFMYRIAATLFFLGFTYVFLLDQANYLNHFYLIALISFLLIFVPADRAVSLDARLDPALRSDTTPAWTLWLLRMQIGLAYFFGGVAKLSPDWLHAEPIRTWLRERTDFPLIGRFFASEFTAYMFAYGGLLLDLLVVPALLWKPTRKYAFAAAVAFHLLNSQLFSIGIFPWFMLFATMLFFPPDTPRKIARALFPTKASVRRRQPAVHTVIEAGPLTTRQKLILASCLAYTAIQVALPLRRLLYTGDVNWTEQGHRFSWQMKLRDKTSEATFFVNDPASGRTWQIVTRDHLSERQAQKMAEKPDMILQFAHYLADYYRRESSANVQVHVKALTSLDGRAPQLMIDPKVDLASVPRSLAQSRWILPLTIPLPRPGSEYHPVDGEKNSPDN